MTHFAKDDNLNIFRLPFGWQYAVANNLGGPLDPTFMATYDSMVQACLATGASCILDLHNYARWNGQIVGQSAISNDALVSFWTQFVPPPAFPTKINFHRLATEYACEESIIFGIMNEPHDLSTSTWSTTVSSVVSAIRSTGALSQKILLPGNAWTSVGAFSTDSGPALSSIIDHDGSTTNLIFDVHQYLDNDGGTQAECVTDGTDNLGALADWLRANKRQALLTETGGGNTESCLDMVCRELAFVSANADVFLGWLGWGAGAFDDGYPLVETPDGGVDKEIVSRCVVGEWVW